MTSEENIAYLREGGRRYILGTPKSELKNFERQLVDGKRYKPTMIAQRIGSPESSSGRAAGLFNVDVQTDARGAAEIVWSKVDAWWDWASLSEGCYILLQHLRLSLPTHLKVVKM